LHPPLRSRRHSRKFTLFGRIISTHHIISAGRDLHHCSESRGLCYWRARRYSEALVLGHEGLMQRSFFTSAAHTCQPLSSNPELNVNEPVRCIAAPVQGAASLAKLMVCDRVGGRNVNLARSARITTAFCPSPSLKRSLPLSCTATLVCRALCRARASRCPPGELWGLGEDPETGAFYTAGYDSFVCAWSSERKRLVRGGGDYVCID
jgi:hypothetical protein